MAISSKNNDFVFEVERWESELVAPAKATPHEFKQLSDIDIQKCLRFHVPMIHLYKHNPNMGAGTDPVKVIKKALAETLVFYYPFAGRLREGPGRKLFVECTAEGILFTQAYADVSFEHFGDGAFQPPFACLDDVLYNVLNSDGIFNSPLLLVQVTVLKCGGFILALRLNHTMTDGFGMLQFMTAIGEIARGASSPSILPVWKRALLNARDPPRVTCLHSEYEKIPNIEATIISVNDMVHRSIFFGPTEIATLRETLPTNLRHCCSSFDLITACLWRTRTIAIQFNPNDEIHLLLTVNLRTRCNSLPLGYYGNAFAYPAAITTASELWSNSLGYAIELIRNVKARVTEEYLKSYADVMMIKESPNNLALGRSYMVSDLTKTRFEDVDLGWGKAIYGGPAKGGFGLIPCFTSYYIDFKNIKGEKGTLVPISLPASAMERFELELNALFPIEKPIIEVKNHK